MLPAGISGLVYALTLIREVSWGDAAELALQANQLGITHPPGYPVHTILGWLFNLVFDDPAMATNIMSAVCTMVAVGLLGRIIFDLCHSLWISVLAALIFALSPRIWSMAILTEVYNVNLLFFALTFFFLMRWYKHPEASKNLFIAAAIFGLSLGAYLANMLLIPAFVIFIYLRRKNDYKQILGFLICFGVTSLLIHSFSYFRSQQSIPLGTLYLPDTLSGVLKYISGKQYDTMAVHDARFYLDRTFEHAVIFSRSLFGLGVLAGLVGFWYSAKVNRQLFVFFLITVVINLGFFTYYQPGDYYTMVGPTYFVFAIWIGFGTRWLGAQSLPVLRKSAIPVLIITCLGLLIVQFPKRFKRSDDANVTTFVMNSYQTFPDDAVVICKWRKFASLFYYQEVEKMREDVTLIEHVEDLRHYDFGQLGTYRQMLDSAILSRPVLVDSLSETVKKDYASTPLDNGWHQLHLRP